MPETLQRNNLKANIVLNRNSISCYNVLEFPNHSQERHRIKRER